MTDSLEATCRRKSAAMQRILDHLRTDEKDHALCLLMGWMSIKDIEDVAAFWDARLSPEEIEAIAAAPDG